MTAAKRGSIINVASAGGEMPAPTLSVYGMTKAGVIHLTRIAAAELGPLGIRANTVAPGLRRDADDPPGVDSTPTAPSTRRSAPRP